MTACVIVGDVHLSDKAPSSRKDTYTDEILEKLAWCVEFANSQRLPIVQAGDLFHIKSPSRTSHRLVQRAWEVLRDTTDGFWIVPGNHDLYADRLESLNSQPLGSLAKMPGVELLIGGGFLEGIYGIPYLTEFDGGDWQAALKPWLDGMTDEDALIVTHAPLFPPGKAPGVYASIDPAQWATEMPLNTSTYYGHIHDPHGVYTANSTMFGGGSHQFANFGAISRGSLHEETVKRWPTICTWDGDTFTEVPLPDDVVRPPEDVFLFEQAEAKAESKSSADDFANAIASVTLTNLTPEEVVNDIRKANPDKAVMGVVESVIEHAMN